MSLRMVVATAGVLLLLAACGNGVEPTPQPQGISTTTEEPAAAPTTTSGPTTTAPSPQPSTTITTLDTGGVVLHQIPDYGFALFGPHVASTFAPASGWVTTRSPAEFGVWFPGVVSPDSLSIADTGFTGTGGKDWGAEVEVSYQPGVNYVPVAATRGPQTTSVTIPITYLPNATVQLARVAAADATSITLDYGYWDSDGDFEFPADADPGVVETVPVAADAYVILHETAVADYAWFLDQYQQQIARDDLGWYPDPDTAAYWATIDNGHLVELWYIPVG